MVIGEIKKNENDVLRISLESYKGMEYIDVRIWSYDYKGNLFRTKNGVVIGKKMINLFLQYLMNAKDALSGEEAF